MNYYGIPYRTKIEYNKLINQNGDYLGAQELIKNSEKIKRIYSNTQELKRYYGLQQETREYLRRLYSYGRELRSEDINDIDEFIKGLKQLNLWNFCTCWIFRSIYNLGSGSNVLNLKANDYNGTMVNSPTWGTQGISFGPLISSIQINYPFSLINFIKDTPFSISSCINKHGQDNACLFEIRGAPVSCYYGTFYSNDNTVSQLAIPVITRNSIQTFISNRGGVVPNGFTSIGLSVGITYQSTYKNGILIVSDSNLAPRNAFGNISLCRTGNGNIRNGTLIIPFLLLFNNDINANNHLNVYNLIKNTIGKNLGLT